MNPFDSAWSVIKAADRQMMLDYYMTDEERAAMPEAQPQREQFSDSGVMDSDKYHYSTRPTVPEGMSTTAQAPQNPPASIVETFFPGSNRTEHKLVDRDGNFISSVKSTGEPTVDFKRGLDTYMEPLQSLIGDTRHDRRREGNYRTLLTNLIRQGFPIFSTERNHMSDPFHRKFIRNIPPDIDAYVRYNEFEPYNDFIEYTKKPRFSPASYGDLAEFDMGMLPLHRDRRTEMQRFQDRLPGTQQQKLRVVNLTPIRAPDPYGKERAYSQTRILPQQAPRMSDERYQTILNNVGWHRHASQPGQSGFRFHVPERLRQKLENRSVRQ